MFFRYCKNISAIVPDMGEPMATPFSGWYITGLKMRSNLIQNSFWYCDYLVGWLVGCLCFLGVALW